MILDLSNGEICNVQNQYKKTIIKNNLKPLIMKTLLIITTYLLLSTWVSAQEVPDDSSYEAHVISHYQRGNSLGWTISLEPHTVMRNLHNLNAHLDILSAPETYNAKETEVNLEQLTIDFSLPSESIKNMLNLQKNRSNKLQNAKTDDALVMKLDSAVSSFRKLIYNYNPQGELIETITHFRDLNGNWNPYYKMEFTEEPNLLQTVYYLYNAEEEGWDNYYKENRIYGESNEIVQVNTYMWQSFISVWLPDGQMEYFYDESGNNTEYTFLMWDGLVFYPYYHKASNYNEQNVLLESIEKLYNLELNQLVNEIRIQNSVNAEGHIENSLTSFWNTENELWENNAVSDFIYNNQGLVYSIENSLWQPENNVFIRKSRTEYFYQNGDEIATGMNFIWSEEMGDWIGFDKYDRALDAVGNEVSFNYSFWNSEINNWSPLFKTERTHDTSILAVNILLPVGFPDTESMLLEEDFYQYSEGNHVLTSNTQFYYTPLSIISGMAGHPENIKVSIYPNPCREIINVMIDQTAPYTFELYDIAGKQVIQQREVPTSQINTSGLDSGIYVYRIHGNGEVMTGKIIKE